MGITGFSHQLLNKYLEPSFTMLELGNQNLYFNPHYGEVAKPYYESRGHKHVSVDINGKDGAISKNLGDPLELGERFDIVTDFGTSEHVAGFYGCWKNKHDHCKLGGLIVSENPKTENWKGHGHHYLTQLFYRELAEVMNYNILEIGEHPAMSNTKDGWNIYCVMRKNEEEFITKEEFNKLPVSDV